jgi:hypothetical protein
LAIGVTIATGLGIGTAELITFGIRDTGNGTITAKCGITATINRAIEAGGGVVKNALWLTTSAAKSSRN